MEQDPMNAPDAGSSLQSKHGTGGRLLRRTIGAVGRLLFLFGMFLAAITISNLRREVAPPEISGPEQVERNAAKSPVSPTSSTLTVSSPTSGTLSPLNLDDFPHLSPTMRKLAQGWLDQCAETDRLIVAISDPALRAQALSLLKDREARMRILLNLPMEWENRSYREAVVHLNELLASQNPYGAARDAIWNFCRGFSPGTNPSYESFLQKLPELADSLRKEVAYLDVVTGRMCFELPVRKQMWNTAALFCFATDRNIRTSFYDQDPSDVWMRGRMAEMNTREEGVYCMRQTGGASLGWLTTYSYQRALDSLMDDPHPSRLYSYTHEALVMPNDFVVGCMAEFTIYGEREK